MHDWTLMRIRLDWESGLLTIELRNPKSELVELTANGLKSVLVPRREEWGPSISINKVEGPDSGENGEMRLRIQMQSGDTIELVAKHILLPAH